jgi:glycosyltransferase involved in cell wall biosynthesis
MNLVSVVIPTYNRNDLLFGRSLASVLRQSHHALDVHIVADGMVDPELEIMERRLKLLNDHRVRFWNIPRQLYPEDPGQKWCVLGLNARNHGLNYAEGDWVSSIDDDDEWTDTHVEDLLGAAKAKGVDFAYGISQYHWPDKHYQTAGRVPLGYGALCDGSQVYRNGMGYRYDPACISRGLPEDGDLWERMRAGGVTYTFFPQVVHHYYVNPR